MAETDDHEPHSAEEALRSSQAEEGSGADAERRSADEAAAPVAAEQRLLSQLAERQALAVAIVHRWLDSGPSSRAARSEPTDRAPRFGRPDGPRLGLPLLRLPVLSWRRQSFGVPTYARHEGADWGEVDRFWWRRLLPQAALLAGRQRARRSVTSVPMAHEPAHLAVEAFASSDPAGPPEGMCESSRADVAEAVAPALPSGLRASASALWRRLSGERRATPEAFTPPHPSPAAPLVDDPDRRPASLLDEATAHGAAGLVSSLASTSELDQPSLHAEAVDGPEPFASDAAQHIAPLAQQVIDRRLGASAELTSGTADAGAVSPARLFWWPTRASAAAGRAMGGAANAAQPGGRPSVPFVQMAALAPISGLSLPRPLPDRVENARGETDAPGLLGALHQVHQDAAAPLQRPLDMVHSARRAERWSATATSELGRWRVRAAMDSDGPHIANDTRADQPVDHTPYGLQPSGSAQTGAAASLAPSAAGTTGVISAAGAPPDGGAPPPSTPGAPGSTRPTVPWWTPIPLVGGFVNSLLRPRLAAEPTPSRLPSAIDSVAAMGHRPGVARGQATSSGSPLADSASDSIVASTAASSATTHATDRRGDAPSSAAYGGAPAVPSQELRFRTETAASAPQASLDSPPGAPTRASLFEALRPRGPHAAEPQPGEAVRSQPSEAVRSQPSEAVRVKSGAPVHTGDAPAPESRRPHRAPAPVLPERPWEASDAEFAEVISHLPAPMAAAAIAAGVLGQPPPPLQPEAATTTSADTGAYASADSAQSGPDQGAMDASGFVLPSAHGRSARPSAAMPATQSMATSARGSLHSAVSVGSLMHDAHAPAAFGPMTVMHAPSGAGASGLAATGASTMGAAGTPAMAFTGAPAVAFSGAPAGAPAMAAASTAAGIARAPLGRAVDDAPPADALPASGPAPTSSAAAPAAGAPGAPPDLDHLAEEVFDRLRWRLAIERDRNRE